MNIDELIRMSLLETERDAALAELRRVRPVVDAAKTWRGWMRLVDLLAPGKLSRPSHDLAAAVDALEAAEAAEREVPDA